MKTWHLIAAAAALIVLTATVPMVASATNREHGHRVIKQVGEIDGDEQTRVTLRVVIDGPSVEVERFKARDVLVRCDDGPSRIDAFTALKPIAVGTDGAFGVRLRDAEGGVLKVHGAVGARGRSTTGAIKTNRFPAGGQTCKSPKQTFTTSAGA